MKEGKKPIGIRKNKQKEDYEEDNLFEGISMNIWMILSSRHFHIAEFTTIVHNMYNQMRIKGKGQTKEGEIVMKNFFLWVVFQNLTCGWMSKNVGCGSSVLLNRLWFGWESWVWMLLSVETTHRQRHRYCSLLLLLLRQRQPQTTHDGFAKKMLRSIFLCAVTVASEGSMDVRKRMRRHRWQRQRRGHPRRLLLQHKQKDNGSTCLEYHICFGLILFLDICFSMGGAGATLVTVLIKCY